MKNLSHIDYTRRIQQNKEKLDNYLSDFHPSNIDDYLNLFSEVDFDCGVFLFVNLMHKKIAMPKIGKSSFRYWLSRGWTKEESIFKRKKLIKDPNSSPMNINFWINKGFTKEEAISKIKSQRKMNNEFWIERGFSEMDAILNSKEHQINSNKVFVDKFKNDELFKTKIKSKYSSCIEFWIKQGYSLEEAKLKRSERQTTFSLEICIEKYGDIEGPKIWQKRQEKWNKSLSKGGNLKVGYSKISQILFEEICLNLSNLDFIFYATKNKEFSITNSEKGFLYDFTDLKNKKIIEFNGDKYHGNPAIYTEYDKPHPFKDITAEKLWLNDKYKLDLAELHGFDLLVIWETDYRKDKKIILNKCLKFLKNGN